ncbi:MAG: glycosyltransferase [Candidatus Limiplasma sp.]|nr:glycosyltransferase [Candidatus Limiplasma sp.]
MKRTVVYCSSCALDGAGKPDPFFLQELPWLLAHFDRVILCSYYGVAEITDPRPAKVTVRTPALGKLRAKLRAPFSMELWRELRRLRRDGGLTPTAAAKLLLFTVRGYTLAYWMRALLRRDEQTTLYAFWMSYEGYAAALCKRRNPSLRAVARAHAFDIDRARNPLNPYLMKRFMGRVLDGLYPISEDAKARLLDGVTLPEEKIHVLGLGSPGGAAQTRFPAPRYKDGVFRLLSCASLIPIKQVPLLIDALALWQGGPVQWTHVGGGPEEAAVRAHAAQALGLRHGIELRFLGAVEHEVVEQLYAVQPFDVFVNTSRSEGVPVSIMEAMRAGVPVVAPAVGGIPELVDSAVGCLYEPEGGAQAVCDALAAIAAQPSEQAEAMRAAAQERWNERCRSDRLLAQLLPKGRKGESAP